MELIEEDLNGLRVIRIDATRIDAVEAIRFKDRMRELTDTAHKRIILDMSSVEFIDSSGLGAIVAAMKQAGSQKSLELAGLSTTVQKVFKLTRMETIFKIHPDVGTALGGDLANAS